jgi:hypothetical protein
LRAFHLALHAGINVALNVQLFQFDIQNFFQLLQALDGIKHFEQFLFFFKWQIDVRRNRVSHAARIIRARRANHRVVIHSLRKFHILLEKRGNTRHQLFRSRRRFKFRGNHAQRRAEKSFVGGDVQNFRAFNSFHQHANISFGQLHALHDVRNCADGVNVFRFRIVNAGVQLCREENALIAGDCFFQRAH